MPKISVVMRARAFETASSPRARQHCSNEPDVDHVSGPGQGQLATTRTSLYLSDGRDSSRGGDFGVSGNLAAGRGSSYVLLWAVPGNVAGLATLVACFTRRVQRTAVRGRAVAGNMAQLATSITLHRLSLAVPSKVIRSTALVAGRMASTTGKTTAPETAETATADGGTTTHVNAGGVRARASKMTRLPAIITAAVTTTGTA